MEEYATRCTLGTQYVKQDPHRDVTVPADVWENMSPSN
jgi:hypothetical protein